MSKRYLKLKRECFICQKEILLNKQCYFSAYIDVRRKSFIQGKKFFNFLKSIGGNCPIAEFICRECYLVGRLTE